MAHDLTERRACSQFAAVASEVTGDAWAWPSIDSAEAGSQECKSYGSRTSFLGRSIDSALAGSTFRLLVLPRLCAASCKEFASRACCLMT